MAKNLPEPYYYIGLMSGTSMDGVDAVLVEFKENNTLNLIKTLSHPIPKKLRTRLINTLDPNWKGSLSNFGTLHQELGKLFANATTQLLLQTNLDKNQIHAIGSHGQTLWHQPDGEYPFSLQLGDANLIAELTGIKTVADFRNRDIAAGGQGAPLVPAFHQAIFSSTDKFRVILNIGGIANITILPALLSEKTSVSGFDTGPGNALSDAWIKYIKKKNYDHNGDWANTGKIHPEILSLLLSEPYFSRSTPKSTGKELFNLNWLKNRLGNMLDKVNAEDIQATLCELTAKTISDNIPKECDELYICGGGIHNQFLIKCLQKHLPKITCLSTQILGIDPDWVEATAFAWLAKQTINEKPGNLPAVTGATGKRVLGAIYSAN